MKKIKTAILISGRGSNMKALIDACKDKDFPAEIALVISNKKDAFGLQIAKNEGIETRFINHKSYGSRVEFDREMTKAIKEAGCEVICLAGFMRLLSGEFTRNWAGKAINIHPSLLPDFKGANAVEDAFNAGVSVAGCSVHYLVEEMDSGEIIEQAQVEVSKNDDLEGLKAKILQKEHEIYPKALKKLCFELL